MFSIYGVKFINFIYVLISCVSVVIIDSRLLSRFAAKWLWCFHSSLLLGIRVIYCTVCVYTSTSTWATLLLQ